MAMLYGGKGALLPWDVLWFLKSNVSGFFPVLAYHDYLSSYLHFACDEFLLTILLFAESTTFELSLF